MLDAPSVIDQKQLVELGLRVESREASPPLGGQADRSKADRLD